MAAFLKHEPTGTIYPFNPDLAKREDMVAYTPEPAKTSPRKPAPKPKAAVKVEPVVNDDLDLGDD